MLRVANTYDEITSAWFLGDEGELTDHAIKRPAMQNEFDPQRARLYLEYIQIGLTHRQACIEVPLDERMINTWTRGKRGAPPSYVEAYKIAREYQAHAMAHEVVDIADGTDRITSLTKQIAKDSINNPWQKSLGHVMARHRKEESNKVGERIASRKWYVSKIAPSHYGEKVQLEHSGGNKAVRIDHSKLTDDQLKRLIDLDKEISGE